MSRASSTRSTRIRYGELRSSLSASGHSRHTLTLCALWIDICVTCSLCPCSGVIRRRVRSDRAREGGDNADRGVKDAVAIRNWRYGHGGRITNIMDRLYIGCKGIWSPKSGDVYRSGCRSCSVSKVGQGHQGLEQTLWSFFLCWLSDWLCVL